MSQKPSIPQGTRDFTPRDMLRRRYIFSTIESVFRTYGFQQIETPSMENIGTLTGKYGDEGDTLLFRVLNSGDYLSKVPDEVLSSRDSAAMLPHIVSRGLRYDLTVPFARYVVMHRHEIDFPFKRYQIQPVWRADRPQKGRYREFVQCDADIVGSDSLLYEAELICIYDEVFHRLGLPVEIRINHRKLLEGVARECGFGEQFTAFTVIIDKLDKIGEEKVRQELSLLGGDAGKAMSLLATGSLNREFLSALRTSLSGEQALNGIAGLEGVLDYLEHTTLKNTLVCDGTLARGLNYYTGTILEVQVKGLKMGSVGGGGRYDNLTGIFGLDGVSGVGISFGAERIYEALEESGLFPDTSAQAGQVLFCCMDEQALPYAFALVQQCRDAGIAAELYPTAAKLKKQLGYADARQIPFAAIIGQQEMDSGLLSCKDLRNGTQSSLKPEELIKLLKNA